MIVDPQLVVLPRTWLEKIIAEAEFLRVPERQGFMLAVEWLEPATMRRWAFRMDIPHIRDFKDYWSWRDAWFDRLADQVRDGTRRGELRFSALIDVLPAAVKAFVKAFTQRVA